MTKQVDIEVKPQDEIEKYKSQADEYLTNWKRERADFVNYKKEQEKKDLDSWLYQNSLIATIDAVRDLRTAIHNFSNQSNMEEFMGIEKLQRAIERAWEYIGIRKIQVDGKEFDPKVHEALIHEEGGEKLVEIAPGYCIGEKVIRPARVKIIK